MCRPQFEDALRLFARVREAMKAREFSAPVLVGGAAVEAQHRTELAERRIRVTDVRDCWIGFVPERPATRRPVPAPAHLTANACPTAHHLR